MNHLSDIEETISKFGLVVIGCEHFAYSIGRSHIGQPELLVSCPSRKACHIILNMVHEHFIENGVSFGYIGGLLEDNKKNDMYVYAAEIEKTPDFLEEYVIKTELFYALHPHLLDGSTRYVQIFLPDINGKYPFNDGYDNYGLPQEQLATIKRESTH